MATVNYVETPIHKYGDNCKLVTWPDMANGDVGQAYPFPGGADRSVQFYGTFGTGGTVLMKGSNVSATTNFVVLTDPQGNIISKMAEAIEQVTEVTAWMRPEVTNGDGTTAISVALLVRRAVYP